MKKDYRFVYQLNQYWGELLPCTASKFYSIIDSGTVVWKIAARRAVASAVACGQDLTAWTRRSDFQQYCLKQAAKPRGGEAFRSLSDAQKLLKWTEQLKASLPCFIFGASGFDLLPVTDKLNNPVLDAEGKPVMRRRRKLLGIHLSGLFMFDADHLPCDPREVFLRTQVAGFPWRILLAHKTSSGHGLRLVAQWRAELGNIADNQICLARELHLMGVRGTTGKPVVDDSCIDASRISYAPCRNDIYFIDENHLFYS